MNLHEYQAKAILRGYGLPIPKGEVASTAEGAVAAAKSIGGNKWVVKAQVHAGQRGRAGGVRIVESVEEAGRAARELLGKRIVTGQTGPDGLLVKKVYVEEAADVETELYAAVIVNRSKARVAVIVNRAGGEDIEESFSAGAGATEIFLGDEGTGSSKEEGAALGLSPTGTARVLEILSQARRAFRELDASLIEFNPLAMTKDGNISVLDVKMVLDDNALWRHPNLADLRDEDEVDPQEREAGRFELNYARLDGDIGVMVTGAGLGLAALDMIKQEGGEPANFMDIRPVASSDQIAEGMLLLLRDKRVRAVLVFAMGGGILRCDRIADAIASAYRKSQSDVPIVFHAAGTGKEIGELTLRNQGIGVTIADSLAEATQEAVRIAAARAG
jgi:succinyl-CoA synthetase beta subunit